jgi:hypothetical protein
MLLAQARVVGVGPLGDLTFPFADDDGAPRRAVVVLGGGGVGKTSLLAAIASTRPGYAVALPRARKAKRLPFAVTEWALGDDDPARPHPLRVASPNVRLEEREDEEALRRREQALFDRKATEGGFVLLAFSSGRWFSRTSSMLTAPERTIARWDVRTSASFDDATRADLARDTKSALAYAAVAGALAQQPRFASERMEILDRAMREAVAPLAALAGLTFLGADPVSLEPVFELGRGGPVATFDELPTHARHLVAFAALTVRALHGAYPGKDPRAGEATVLVDDVDLHQDATTQRGLVAALREALPNVQWVLTAQSPAVTYSCAAADVLALRIMPGARDVQLYEGERALVH